MTVQDDAALEAETRAILEAAGARRIRVDGAGDHWLVSAHFGSTQRLGHTGISAETSYDPRDLARRLIAREGAPHAPALAEDEDPGEQPEIFTEEDVEAAGAVAASEPELEAFEPSLAASAPELAAYPGIMPLRNELEDLRSDVIRAISDQKRMRLRVAMDPSRADFLSERFAQYNNAGALGIEPDEGLIADRNAFLAMQSQERAINAFALSLEDAAATADEAKLRAMHAGLGDGWP